MLRDYVVLTKYSWKSPVMAEDSVLQEYDCGGSSVEDNQPC